VIIGSSWWRNKLFEFPSTRRGGRAHKRRPPGPELPQPAFLEIGRGLTRGDTPAYPSQRGRWPQPK